MLMCMLNVVCGSGWGMTGRFEAGAQLLAASVNGQQGSRCVQMDRYEEEEVRSDQDRCEQRDSEVNS